MKSRSLQTEALSVFFSHISRRKAENACALFVTIAIEFRRSGSSGIKFRLRKGEERGALRENCPTLNSPSAMIHSAVPVTVYSFNPKTMAV